MATIVSVAVLVVASASIVDERNHTMPRKPRRGKLGFLIGVY
jgi:hypothetical protein